MNEKNGKQKALSAIGPAGRIIVFIILSLVLWVLISIAVNTAYALLPSPDTVKEGASLVRPSSRASSTGSTVAARMSQSSLGGDSVTSAGFARSTTADLRRSAPRRGGDPPDSPNWLHRAWAYVHTAAISHKLYFILVLPVAMLIAGLIVWPNDDDGAGRAHAGNLAAN